MKLEEIDLDNILINEKSHENILIYDISYKTLIGSKPLRIRFNKINGITRIYDGSRYLSLPGTENYDVIYDRIRYLISLKSSITYIFFTICENQSWFLWFFNYIKNIDFYNTH